MFRNDNKKSPNKLASASLRHSLRRNGFVLLSIALSTSLIMIVALYFLGMGQQYSNDSIGRYQAALIQVPQDTIDKLDADARLDGVGQVYSVGENEQGDYKINIRYLDETTIRIGHMGEVTGLMPSAKNEVMVERNYLRHIGSNATVGDSIPLTIEGEAGEFIISGILETANETRTFMAIVSMDWVEEPQPLYSVYVSLANAGSMSEAEIKDGIIQVAADVGITEQDVVFSSYYFALISHDFSSSIFVAFGGAAIVAFACALVVYSLFYVSVVGKTNEYGLLRLIGATQKQVRRIVLREGLTLAALSIPVGVLIGAVLGYLIIPKGWHLPTSAVVALVTIITMVIVVLAATMKPVKIASKVTPIEALRHVSYEDDAKKKETARLHRRITPTRLGLMNLGRNKKKAALTILSLGFCGILLMASASYLNSINYEDMARTHNPYGDVMVVLGEDSYFTYTTEDFYELQADNPIDDTLVSDLMAIPGVEGTKKYSGIYAKTNLPGGATEPTFLHGFTEDEQAYMNKNLMLGTVDYFELEQGMGVVLDASMDWKGIYGWEPALGDVISVETPNGATELTVMGIISTFSEAGESNMMIPYSLLEILAPDIQNYTYYMPVIVENGQADAVETAVRELIAPNMDLSMQSLKDITARYETQFAAIKMPIYAIVIFIGIFGIINLINTLITNVLVRKKELSVFQTLGLSQKQLRHTLLLEGFYYVGCTAILTLVFGTAVGYVLCTVFDTVGLFGRVIYHFPAAQAAVYLLALVVVQMICSLLSIITLQKQSLVERMRDV